MTGREPLPLMIFDQLAAEHLSLDYLPKAPAEQTAALPAYGGDAHHSNEGTSVTYSHSDQPVITPGIRRPRSTRISYTARQVAAAYGAPLDRADGSGVKVGIVELGGGYESGDMAAAGLPNRVTVVPVDGGRSLSDGPNGADGEVMLDVEVVGGIAPGADIRVYFAPNTDAGFVHATEQALAECHVVSISWGGPESQWTPAALRSFSSVIAAGRARGVPCFVASGDTGSRDGTGRNVVDFPAGCPDAIGCGGTELHLNADGSRAAEVTWDDDDLQSATGGGVSKVYPGRQVPDVAGCASPSTGYRVVVDGGQYVIGGTSAVAPLYAACFALTLQVHGSPFDLLNTVLTNPTVCFDVTVGDNGGFKAGPGRDQTTGFGVVDWGRLLTVLTSGTQVPAPGGGQPGPPNPPPSTPPPSTPPTSSELPGGTALLRSIGEQINRFLASSSQPSDQDHGQGPRAAARW